MTIKADMKGTYYFKCRMKVDASVRTFVETPNSLACVIFDTRNFKWVNLSTETLKCSLILINHWYVVLEFFLLICLPWWSFLKHNTGKFVDVKSCTNHQTVYSWIDSSYFVYWDACLCLVVEPNAPCTPANVLWQTSFARVDETIFSIFFVTNVFAN